jgi:hypothetical protein
MTSLKCPKCPVEYVNGRFVNEYDCVDLKGTKYLDPNLSAMFGPQWCPTFAPRLGSLSNYPAHRGDVDAEIQKARDNKRE